MSPPSSLPTWLQRPHSWARAQPWLWRFTLVNRLLLAMAFLPTGLVKATGQRFTTIPVDDPIGFFFEAMYQTGPYWRFIGMTQIAAAILLMIPRTATLGALVFAPVSVSIFLITWGVGFGNTAFITAGMVLSVTYLLCWDADKLWAGASHLLSHRRGPGLLEGAHWLERVGWALGGLAGMGLILVTRGFIPNAWINDLFFLGVGAAAMVVVGWIAALSRSGRAKLDQPGMAGMEHR